MLWICICGKNCEFFQLACGDHTHANIFRTSAVTNFAKASQRKSHKFRLSEVEKISNFVDRSWRSSRNSWKYLGQKNRKFCAFFKEKKIANFVNRSDKLNMNLVFRCKKKSQSSWSDYGKITNTVSGYQENKHEFVNC